MPEDAAIKKKAPLQGLDRRSTPKVLRYTR
jgi:hypothetical protein